MEVAAQSWEQRELKSFFHTFSDLPSLREDGPVIVDRGEGIYVFDVNGRRYLEGNSALWNVTLGFNNERLIAAATRQYREFPAYHTFFGRNSKSTIELSERMLELAPVPMKRVFFTNSGSEANESAVKALWMIWQAEGQPARRKLISRKNAYHGATIFASSLTGKDYVKAFGLPSSEVVFVGCPHEYRFARPAEDSAAFVQRLARELELTIETEGPETIAGFFAEPVMGAGGVIVPPMNYFGAIQPVLRRYGIPLIADEVICGFGRTGRLWGCQTLGIKPDVIVASKCMTGGYFPMGAVMLSADLDRRLEAASEAYEEFPHGFTTGGHPVGCAIALEAIKIITEGGGALDNVRHVSPHFLGSLNKLTTHALVGEARGIGLMGALEIVSDKAAKAPFDGSLRTGERIAKAARRRGLIIRPLGSALVLAPPFIVTKAQIDEMFAILGSVLDDVQSEIAPTEN